MDEVKKIMQPHVGVFGKETYIVLATYIAKPHDSVVLGNFKDYESALECLKHIDEYGNIQGIGLFSGGVIYTVPENPISFDSDYWNYLRIVRWNQYRFFCYEFKSL